MRKFDAILQPGQKHSYSSLDDSPAPSSSKKRWKWVYQKGWRSGATNCAVAASAVFLINLIITIVCSSFGGDRKGTLYSGNCEKVRRINYGLHILINVLSTVLLSSSNYCMQCLSAPTRKDVDVAHARGKWLDIGVLSIRNLRCIGRKRVTLWALLGLSSLPLHLLYNSAVYMSIAAYGYGVAAVGESFINKPDCEGCSNIKNETWSLTGDWYEPGPSVNSFWSPYHDDQVVDTIKELHQKSRDGLLDKLDNLDCINQYSRNIQSSRGNLLLVVRDADVPTKKPKGISNTSPVFASARSIPFNEYNFASSDPYQWICRMLKDDDTKCMERIGKEKADPSNWRIGEYCEMEGQPPGFCYENMKGPIQYCLSESLEERCEIQWSLEIAIVVALLNLFKAALIFYTAFGIEEEPLMSLGDAVASFLDRPDPTTSNMCIASQVDITTKTGNFNAGARRWNGKRFSWRHGASRTRRFSTFSLIIIVISVIAFLFHTGVSSLNSQQLSSVASLARLGFGALDPRTLIQYLGTDVLQNTLVANSPQIVISMVYYSYNSLFTCMLLSYEWATYASKRKGLRVTTEAKGAQRSSYFLSLPYRFGLPLVATSGLMHWLVSQSIFLAKIDWYSPTGKFNTSIATCGYSPIVMMAGIIVGVVMLLLAVGIGYIPHRKGTTLVGSCSAAMSAACHPLSFEGTEGKELVYKKLMWGVVGVRPGDGVAHCSFSDGPVETLEKGRLYAGQ